MAKVKLSELKTYPFQTELTVRVTDINYGGHLGYDQLLGMAHEARIQLLKQLNASELDLGDGQTGVVAVDLAVMYRNLAFLGDGLSFEIGVVGLKRASFRLTHRVRRVSDGNDIAFIELCLAAVDHKAQVKELPETFHTQLERLAASSGA